MLKGLAEDRPETKCSLQTNVLATSGVKTGPKKLQQRQGEVSVRVPETQLPSELS